MQDTAQYDPQPDLPLGIPAARFVEQLLDIDFLGKPNAGVVIGLPDQLDRIAIAGHQLDSEVAGLGQIGEEPNLEAGG